MKSQLYRVTPLHLAQALLSPAPQGNSPYLVTYSCVINLLDMRIFYRSSSYLIQIYMISLFFNLFHITPTQQETLQNLYIQSQQREGKEQAMATQALLSSMEAGRQLLGGRPLQFTSSRFIGSSRKDSFVVRAASTPPVKVSVHQ